MITVNGHEVKITRFPDNTFKFDLDRGKDGVDTLNHWAVHWDFESMEELFTLQGLKTFLGSGSWDLVMPYIPNARMDKTVDDNEGFMLKYMADIINSLSFSKVYVADPHSNVSGELINRMVELDIEELITQILEQNTPDLVVFPDKGAADRYTQLECFKGYEIAYGVKERNQRTGEIISFDIVGEFEGKKTALIVDDICSKGGTFFHTANKLREKGLEIVNLYVTHLEDTVKEGQIIGDDSPIDNIFTLNRIGGW